MNEPTFIFGLVFAVFGIFLSFFFYLSNIGCVGRDVCEIYDPISPLLLLTLPGLLLLGVSFALGRNSTKKRSTAMNDST